MNISRHRVEVKEVNNKRQFRDFINLVDFIYKPYPNYVFPVKLLLSQVFDRRKNPFWEQAEYRLFVVYMENKPVGRIAAIFSKPKSEGYFGYFECIDNAEVARCLCASAGDFLKQKGLNSFAGPFNPSINYELGVLTSGFERKPFFMMNYNPPYYPGLLEKVGAMEEMAFAAYEQPCGIKDKKINRVCSRLLNKYNLKIKEINYSDYDNQALMLCRIYNDAFKSHWGFVPFSENEFVYLARSLKQILNKRLLFNLTLNDEPVAFILAIPDVNEAIKYLPEGRLTPMGIYQLLRKRKKIKWVKVMVAAVKEKYQHMGLGSLLYAEMAKRVEEEGYLGGEISWVANDNKRMKKIVEEMGAKQVKVYRVYKMEV